MVTHKLSSLETRKLEMLLGGLGFKPLGVINQLAVLTELAEMLKYDINTLRSLGAFDPASNHFMESYLHSHKCLNLLARYTTSNPNDLNICIDKLKAATYSLAPRTQESLLQYVKEVAEVTNCTLLEVDKDKETLLFLRQIHWLRPSEKTSVTEVLDFLRSENIPFHFESKIIASIIYTKEIAL